MRLAVFSDVHGNALWLEAVLKQIETAHADKLYFLGDSVSYFPDAAEVIHSLKANHVICVEGNHDSMLRGEFPIPERNDSVYQLRSTMETLPKDCMAYVRSWPETRFEKLGGLRVQFVHGSPVDHLKGYSYEDSPLAGFDSPKRDVVFVGHTHRPWIRQNKHTLMINVGSVGLPRDIGTSPSWVLFDTQKNEVHLNRLQMDPLELLNRYPHVHESVRECLKRDSL